MGRHYGERARALVGTPFRPQGRDPATGVDCVGLALFTYGIRTNAVRSNYRLRGDHRAEIEHQLARFFRRTRAARPRQGDLMLLAVSAGQFHLAIRTDLGFVHADARLGRTVETPGVPQWPTIAIFRKRAGSD